MIIFDTKYPFGYKNVMGDFVTFPDPVKVTFQFTDTSKVLGSHKMPQGEPQIQEATTTPPEDPFAAEDKFEAPAEVVVFKGQPPQEIIEGWCLKIHPWYISKTKIGVGVLDNRKFDPKFIKETARKNRFKRLRLVKRKIDENKSSSVSNSQSRR